MKLRNVTLEIPLYFFTALQTSHSYADSTDGFSLFSLNIPYAGHWGYEVHNTCYVNPKNQRDHVNGSSLKDD